MKGKDTAGEARAGTMLAARLHGPRDLRVERVPHPGPPGPGEVLLRVRCTGICGSDLHSFADARIGDTPIEGPLVLGHEFSAVVEAVGPEALDGQFQPVQPGVRVAVDPAQPCGRCELCEHGHPNLCLRLAFCGNYPHGGSFCQWLHMPARSCFPVPVALSDVEAALLEPLGVAIHAVDLAKPRVGASLAILGAGPIGLLILQVAKLAGADPVFVSDRFPWRLKRAEHYGGVPVPAESPESLPGPRDGLHASLTRPAGTLSHRMGEGRGEGLRGVHLTDSSVIQYVAKETGGRGVDIAIEAAWADQSVEVATELARLGGRVVLVGIPGDDRLAMKHSTARRKGLTVMLSRRMKHVYPRAIRLALRGAVDLEGLVTHRYPLRQAAQAFRLNAAYRDKVVKVVVAS